MPPRRPIDRRLPAALALLCALGTLLLAAPSAFAGIFTPESGGGSPVASETHTLYLITLLMGVPIFLAVEGVLIYSLINHRFRRGAPEPAQIRGNTRLEMSWTIGAAVILVVIAAITFAFLSGIVNPPVGGSERADALEVADAGQPPVPGRAALNVHVVGQQYIWRFDYPGVGLFSYHTMVVPTNTVITLDITSSDVQHSFWIPALFGKADAIPGYVNHRWFEVTKEGSYMGNCAFLCGENHAQMIAEVKAVPPDEFRAWEARQRSDIAASIKALQATRRQALRQPGNVTAGPQ